MKQLMTLLILSFAIPASAQLKIGVTGGVNMSNGYDNKFSFLEFSPLTSYNIGISADVMVLNRLSFEPAVLYSNKGWTKASITSSSFEVNSDFFKPPNNFEYLSGQMNWKFHLTKSIKLIAGPEVNFLLRAKSGELNVTDNLVDDWEIAIFGGLEISLLDRISLHVKYSKGLNPVSQTFYKESGGEIIGASETKNRTLMLGATVYPFKMKKID